MKLFITILFGFIIPWIIGIIINFKDNKVITCIAPFSCAIAFILNDLGITLGYFHPSVYNYNPYLLSQITNIGLFTIESCILIFVKRNTRIKTMYLLVLTTIFASIIDLILFSTNMLIFGKGWNIMWSVILYFITFYIIYLYYLLLKKLNIFQKYL
jgi:hypothetical protein